MRFLYANLVKEILLLQEMRQHRLPQAVEAAAFSGAAPYPGLQNVRECVRTQTVRRSLLQQCLPPAGIPSERYG